MKKLYLSLLCIVVTFLVSFADDNPVSVMKGSVELLRNPASKLSWEIDYSKAKCAKKPLFEYLEEIGKSKEEWDAFEPEVKRYFRDKWEKNIDHNDGAKLVDDPNLADLHMVIKVRTFNIGNDKAHYTPGTSYSAGATMSGYVHFFKKGESTPFCVLEILEMYGTYMGATVQGNVGRCWLFNDLAEYICEIIEG